MRGGSPISPKRSPTCTTRQAWVLQLNQIERDIKTIDDKLASVNQPLDLAYSLEGVREFASAKLLDLRALVHADITAARTALAKHIAQIVLTPKKPQMALSTRSPGTSISSVETRCNGDGGHGRIDDPTNGSCCAVGGGGGYHCRT